MLIHLNKVIVWDEYYSQYRLVVCLQYNFEKTIVDTGTTNLRLPDRVFTQLIKAMRQKIMVRTFLYSYGLNYCFFGVVSEWVYKI